MIIDLAHWASVAGALLTLLALFKMVVQPFQKAMTKNDLTMQKLQDTIKELAFELKDSQKDRQNIHRQLERHENRIGKVEDDVIVNSEQIKTLFKTGGKHD